MSRATMFPDGTSPETNTVPSGIEHRSPRKLAGNRATELQCQATIVEAARVLGYRVLAIRPGRSKGGRWSTPIQGDAGYPDLTLVHPRAGVLFVELKRSPNKLESDQTAWAKAIIEAGAVWRLVWVPEEQDEFVQELADRARQPLRRTS